MNTQSGLLFVETRENFLPRGLILLHRDSAFNMGSVEEYQTARQKILTRFDK
jgi:hypothetical protein